MLKPSLLISFIAIAVLGVGIGAWFMSSRPTPPPSAPRPSSADIAEDSTLGDEIVDEALRQIPGFVDSTAFKSQWVEEIDGVDVSALGAEQLEYFVRSANAQRCTCGCGYTLAACRRFDTTCPISLPIVEALRDSVLAGYITTAAGLRERPQHR